MEQRYALFVLLYFYNHGITKAKYCIEMIYHVKNFCVCVCPYISIYVFLDGIACVI